MTTSAPAATGGLRPGARLGPYEIVALLGAGGMGEVYRARDARLDREVAIKVIAFDVSADPARLQRFEQEARAVAALNHPGILALHDVGMEAGAPYQVFELLEGESLRDRMAREAPPPRKAVDWAAQVARGLAAAHDQGIVHRDLKPENLFVTRDGRVKILDFGLAKLFLGEETVAEAQSSSTQSAVTSAGKLLGTVGYMSPEQVRGQAVDARSDIFSLGAVLYEMLSGRRAFRARSAADTLSAILRDDPSDLTSSQGPLPPALERIVRRCLEKDPEERFQSARDLAFDLEALSGLPSVSAVAATLVQRKARLGRALAAGVILGAILVATFLTGRRSALGTGGTATARTPPGEVRFQLTLPNGVRSASGVRFSPDGTMLAFIGSGADGETRLWVRPLSSMDARPLPGTEGVRGTPFWSPDSRSLGFSTDTLKRIDVSGGPPQMLWDIGWLPGAPPFAFFAPWTGGTWSREGVVIFTPGGAQGLYRVSASGGAIAPVTTLDKARGEDQHAHPQFLPDGRHFLFFNRSQDPEHQGVFVGSLDSPERARLFPTEYAATYAWPGYLLTRRGNRLLAGRFDSKNVALIGEATVLAEGVDQQIFAASETGALAFVSNGPANSQLTWFDRHGKQLGTVGEPGTDSQFALSPDGRTAALQRLDASLQTEDIWLVDVARGVSSRFTFDPGREGDPVWSPDGRRLAFSAEGEGKGRRSIYVKELGGASEERVLPRSAHRAFVEDWSRDGRFIFYGAGRAGNEGLWAVPLTGERKAFPVVQAPFFHDEPHLSPNGRLLAYVSTASGRFEVYVQAFPVPGTVTRVSTGGGSQPRWREDGRELFYLAADGTLMAVDIKAEGALELGVPRKLFVTPLRTAGVLGSDRYAVTADGQRFLVLVPVIDTAASPITVVLNWTAGLQK